MTYYLPHMTVTVEDGAGTITSDLHDPQGDSRLGAAYDAIESMVLTHACAGVDISSAAYAEGVKSAVDAVTNHYDEEDTGEESPADHKDGSPAGAIFARFHPQAWINKYAVDVDPDGEDEWDVTPEILAMGKAAALRLEDDTLGTDHLLLSRNAPKWIQRWTGPYWIEVKDNILNYYERCNKKENSLEAA